jgi:hypothetical protein
VTPMQPTLVARPCHVEGWPYEEKVDGQPMLAYKHDGMVRLISRQGVDHTKRFLTAAVAALPYDRQILEGEVAVFDAQPLVPCILCIVASNELWSSACRWHSAFCSVSNPRQLTGALIRGPRARPPNRHRLW